MGSAIVNNNNHDVSLFGALKMLLEDNHPYSKTIFSVIESNELVEKAVEAVQEVVGIMTPGIGFMFTVPIGKIYQMGKD